MCEIDHVLFVVSSEVYRLELGVWRKHSRVSVSIIGLLLRCWESYLWEKTAWLRKVQQFLFNEHVFQTTSFFFPVWGQQFYILYNKANYIRHPGMCSGAVFLPCKAHLDAFFLPLLPFGKKQALKVGVHSWGFFPLYGCRVLLISTSWAITPKWSFS